ncbi:uncharacterized protein TRAVEDRAFT_43417 [Trametes versicolor FP-101664 SS1]|uniref:uncharacterized protein n=1 Tax=Trametes versicolor (strain FP-101664) TaxID=717944 RepID=UPI0004621B26|nr:uncharacterized protein TRAVEDRAFT_43417 [Trametes versicolor FP-101664 SS1]EIW63111.1 hypothetical protein TRAVEDRAFT_43417 [Trametes versicolor FP-101664 SS1]
MHHSPPKPPAGGPARGGAPEADSRRIASTQSPRQRNPKDERARHNQPAPHPPKGINASENRDGSSSHRHVAKELQGAQQISKASVHPTETVRCTTTPIGAPYAKEYASGPGAGMKGGSRSTRVVMSAQPTDTALTATLSNAAPAKSTTTPIIPAGTPSKTHAPRVTPSPKLRRTPVVDPSASTTTSTPKASFSGTPKSRPPTLPHADEQTPHRAPVPTTTAAHRSARMSDEEIGKILKEHMDNCHTKLDHLAEILQNRRPFTREDAARSGAAKAKLKADPEAAAAAQQPPATSQSSPSAATPLVHAKSSTARAENSSQAAGTKTQPPRTTPRPTRDSNAPSRVGRPLPSDARPAAQSTAAVKLAPAVAHSPPRALSDDGSSSVSQSSSQATITPARAAKQAAAELIGRANIHAWCDAIPENACSPSAPPSSVGKIATNALSDISERSDHSTLIQAAPKAPQTSAQSPRAPVAAAAAKPTPTTEPRLSHLPTPATAPRPTARRASATPPPAPKAVPHPAVRPNPPTAQVPRLKTVGTQTTPPARPPLPPTRSTRDIATSTASAPPSTKSLKGGDLPPSKHVPSEATKRSPQMRRILPSTLSEATSTNSMSPKSTTHTAKSDEARSQRSQFIMLVDPRVPGSPRKAAYADVVIQQQLCSQSFPGSIYSLAGTSESPFRPHSKAALATRRSIYSSSPHLTHRKVATEGAESKAAPRRKVEVAAGGSVEKARSLNATTPQPRPTPTPSHRSSLVSNMDSAAMPPSVMDSECGLVTPPIQASNTEVVSSKVGKVSSPKHVRPSTANAACASTGMPVKEVAKRLARLSKADTVVSEVASIDHVLPPLPPLPSLLVSGKPSSSGTRATTLSAKGKERARDLSPERSSAAPSEGHSVVGTETSCGGSPPQFALQQSPAAAASFVLDLDNWSESPKLITAFERGVEEDTDNDDDYDDLVYRSLPSNLILRAPTRPLPSAPSRASSDFAAESLKALNESTAQLDRQHSVALRQPEPRPQPLKSAMKPRPQVVSSALGEPYDLVDAAGASSSRAVRFDAASPRSSSSSTSPPFQQSGESPSSVPSSLGIEEPSEESPPRYSSLSILRAPTRGPLAAAAAAAIDTPLLVSGEKGRSQADASEQLQSQLRRARSVPGPFLFRDSPKLQQIRETQRSGGMYANYIGSRSAASLRNLDSHLGQPLAATEIPQPGPSAASKLWQKAKNGFGLGAKKAQPPQIRWVVPPVKTVPPEPEVRPEWPREKVSLLLRPKS